MQNTTGEIGTHADFKYALILGITIGVFLLPIEANLGINRLYYVLSLCAGPIAALVGLWVAKLLVYRVPILWQFAKFGLVGVANTVINFGVVNALSGLSGVTSGLLVPLFAAVAFLAALINSYIWNSHWSFKNNNQRTAKEFTEFFLVTLVGLLINSAVVYILTTVVGHPASISPKLWLNVSNLVATFTTMFWNFSGFKFLVFKI